MEIVSKTVNCDGFTEKLFLSIITDESLTRMSSGKYDMVWKDLWFFFLFSLKLKLYAFDISSEKFLMFHYSLDIFIAFFEESRILKNNEKVYLLRNNLIQGSERLFSNSEPAS